MTVITCLGCDKEKAYYAKGLCKQCYNRYYREEHPDYGRHWREQHPNYYRRYCEEHREDLAAYKYRYHKENRKKEAAYERQYYEKNRERIMTKLARREARKNALPDTLTPAQAEELFAIGQATYPGEKLHLDHIVPLSKGGGTTRANMHAIPAGLNCSKQGKSPKEAYRQEMLFGTG